MLFKNHQRHGSLLLLGLAFSLPVAAETLQQAWDVAIGFDHGLKAVQENTQASK